MERFIKDEVARNYRSLRRFLKEHDFTDSTYYRVVADSPAIGMDQYRRLEGALDLPRGTLDYIADGNIEALMRTNLDPDQLRVIIEYLDIPSDNEPIRYADDA